MPMSRLCPDPAPTGRPWLRRLCWPLLALGCLTPVFLFPASVLPKVARFLNVSESPVATDFTLVLGGGNETRPFVAAALWKTGRTRSILLTRVKPTPEVEAGLVLADHEVARRVLLARGVPAEGVALLPEVCDSTYDEARALARFLANRPDATVTVVTTNYHTRRSRWIFGQVLGASAAQVYFLGAPTDGYCEDNWWRFEAGWRAYLSEYFKLAFYLVRYQPLHFLGGGLVVFVLYVLLKRLTARVLVQRDQDLRLCERDEG